MRKSRYLACLLQYCLINAVVAQSNELPINDELVLDLMAQENIPGISIAVIEQGQIYAKSFGVKNAELPHLVNNTTIFEAASLTKPVTAYVALAMIEDGLLKLDKPLYQYVDYPDIAHDERHRLITARMILNHTTGFPNGRRGGSLQIYIDPASDFGYSGEAFRYLQSAMESISGETLDVLAERYIFTELGMSGSSYLWRESARDNAATGHGAEGDVGRELYVLNRAFAEGGLETNILDYSHFVRHVLEKYTQNDVTVREMFAPSMVAANHSADGNIYWGLGWGLDISETRKRAWHTGSNGQFKSFVVIDLTENTAVICFLNSTNGLKILPEIVESTLGGSPLSKFYQQTITDSMK